MKMAPKEYNDLVKARKYCRAKITKLHAKVIERGIPNENYDNTRAVYLEKVTEQKLEIDR